MLPVNGLYGHIQKNAMKSALLLASFAVLVALFFLCWCVIYVSIMDARIVTGAAGHVSTSLLVKALLLEGAHRAITLWWVPVVITVVWFAIAWVFYGDMISASTGAEPVTRIAEPKLYNLVENLAITAGLPMPRVEIMETDALNAYASGLGPKSAVVAVTRGLLNTLTKDELEAVLAHEMTHIANRDVRLMVIATVFVGALTLVGNFVSNMFSNSSGNSYYFFSSGRRSESSSSDSKDSDGSLIAVFISIGIAIIFLALTHLLAILVRFAISRSREFMADAGAVQLTKNPDALISALLKIDGHHEMPGVADSMMAMMISADYSSLFATHPAISARVAALQAYAGGRIQAREAVAYAPQQAYTSSAPVGSMGFGGSAPPTFGRRGTTPR